MNKQYIFASFNYSFSAFFLSLLFLLPIYGTAQSGMVADDPLANYDVGENMNFVVSGAFSAVSYEIRYDDKTPVIASGTAQPGPGGVVNIPFTLNEPGAVICTVNGFLKAAATFGAFDIQPLESEPGDFDQFWNNAKNELASVPINPQLSFYSNDAYSTTYRVNLATVNNRRVYGYISIPNGSGPFPAILSLPSFGNLPNLVAPDPTIASQGGAIHMFISIHNAPPDQTDPNGYQPDDTNSPNTMYHKLAVQASLRAVDYISSRNDFNGNLAVTGVSQGGGLAIMTAGLDSRVKLLAYAIPSHCQHTGFVNNKASGFPFYAFTASNQGTQFTATASSKYFDAVYFARRVNVPTLGFTSYLDETSPNSTILPAFNQLKSGPNILMHARDLGHSPSPSQYWNGRLSFFRQYFPAMTNPPQPFVSTSTSYFVSAGNNTSTSSGTASLSGSAGFNGAENFSYAIKWSKVSGPGTVSFSSSTNRNTNATFSSAGTYVLRFMATDAFQINNNDTRYYTLHDFVTVTVTGNGGGGGDTTPPQVTLSADGSTTGPYTVSVWVNESVTGLSASDFNISNGSISNFSGSNQNYTFTVTPISQGNVSVSLPANSANDAAGNGNTTSNTVTTYYTPGNTDNTAPQVTLSADGSTTGPYTVSVWVNESVTGLSASDFNISNGSISNFSGSNQNYTFTVTPISQGNVSVSLPANSANDAAGNGNTTSNTVTTYYTPGNTDNTAPQVTLSADGSTTGPYTVSVWVNESVTGLSASDFNISNGSISNFSGSNQNYTFTVTPISQGNVSVSLPANSANDAAGNGNTTSNTVTTYYTPGNTDNTAPQVTLSADGSTTGPYTVSVWVNESVTGLSASDFNITNGTISNFSGFNQNYTFTVTPINQGNVSVSLPANSANDAAGNGNATSNTVTTYYDAPVVDPSAPQIYLNAPSETQGSYTVSIWANEAVSGLSINDFSISNGTASNFYSSSSQNYTILVTPSNSGNVSVSLPANSANDAAGNGNVASNTVTTSYNAPNTDTTRPSVTLSSASTVSGTFSVNVSFSEPVSGLSIVDFDINNGTATSLTGSGQNYTLTINPGSTGNIFINLPAYKAFDSSNNGNFESNTITVVFESNTGGGGGGGSGVDLEMSVSVDNPQPAIYTSPTFTITVSNTGNTTANNVQVKLAYNDSVLPYTSHTISKGSFDLFLKTWNVGSIGAGQDATLSLTLFTLTSGTSETMFAQVTSASPSDTDSTPNNNVGTTPNEDDEAAVTLFGDNSGGGGGNGGGDPDPDPDPDTPDGYCNSFGEITTTEWIERVGLQEIDNTSGQEGYADFTYLTANLAKGNTYPLTLVGRTSVQPNREYWRIWIDLNRDGVFDPDTEIVHSGRGSNTIYAAIQIPLNAATGLTRMRVSMKRNGYPTPCSQFTYGEVEDYTVNLQSSSSTFASSDTEILSFEAVQKTRSVDLQWATNTEFKNSHFVIERSTDSYVFEAIKEISSRDDNSSSVYYEDTDETPLQGVSFYRLKQVFLDGSYIYSPMRKIIFDIDINEIVLFPNPTNNNIYISMKEFAGKSATVKILDKLGRIVLTSSITELPNYPIQLELFQLQSGVYYVELLIEGNTPITKQIVVHKL